MQLPRFRLRAKKVPTMTDTLNTIPQIPSFSAAPLPPASPAQDFLVEARELLRLFGFPFPLEEKQAA